MARPELVRGRPALELPTEAAFRATLPEMEALAEDELASINVDVVNAVTTVLGCLPKLRTLRPDIARHLGTFDLERFDRLEQYALALNHAHVIHRGAVATRSSIAQLGAEVMEARDRLLDDARSLANHGLLHAERLRECKKAPGYRPAATDVFTLVTLFKEQWSQIENRTPVTAEALQRAGSSALELLAAVGEKDQTIPTQDEAQLVRQRAYTVFVNAYSDIRAAVDYLRRKQGDAGTFAPALIAGRGGRGSSSAAASATEGSPSSGGAGSAAPQADSVAGDPVAPVQVNNPHNLPIDAPFVA